MKNWRQQLNNLTISIAEIRAKNLELNPIEIKLVGQYASNYFSKGLSSVESVKKAVKEGIELKNIRLKNDL